MVVSRAWHSAVSCEWFLQEKPPCEACGRGYDPVRIGVSAIGWAFSFDPDPDNGLRTLAGWRDQLAGGTIVDEYGKVHTLESFEQFVAGKAHQRRV